MLNQTLQAFCSVTLASIALLCAPEAAQAKPAQADFYGVKMKSEDFARNTFIKENTSMPDFTNDRPGTDKRIYAYAYTSDVIGAGRGVSIQVFNHTDKPLSTESTYRELELILRDGSRYDRSETEMMWTKDRIEAGDEATFNYHFPGVRIPSDQVQMIKCAFGLGETKIFLFPMQPSSSEPPRVSSPKKSLGDWFKDKQSAAPQRTASNSQKAETEVVEKVIKKTIKKPVYVEGADETDEDQPNEPKHFLTRALYTPIHAVHSVLKSAGEKSIFPKRKLLRYDEIEVEEKVKVKQVRAEAKPEDKTLPVTYPLQKSEQVVDGVRYNFQPTLRSETAGPVSEEIVTHTDRPWSMKAPSTQWERKRTVTTVQAESPRSMAQVVNIDREHGFVVVDAGLVDGFTKDAELDILRGGRLVARAKIVKIREQVSAALLLPEWQTGLPVQVGDQITLVA